MKYFKKIQGERLYMSPINPDDYEIYTKWMNDPKVVNGLGGYGKVYALLKEKECLEKMIKSGQNYAIVLNEGDELLGNISLMDVDSRERTAELGIFIGEEKNRGKGYGTEAIKIFLEYGFNTLNLQNIMLKVNSNNKSAIKSYEKVGFKVFGRRTKSVYENGKYYDTIYMEVLRED